jgi:oxygen-independent coproporphyrinogen-3 oxidase
MESQFADLVAALCAEMARWREPLQERTVSTVFIGGGTPTVLDEGLLGQLFDGDCIANFRVGAACEITCEANPGAVDRGQVCGAAPAGRQPAEHGRAELSNRRSCAFLGRIHSVDDVFAAYAAARSAQFCQHQPGLHLWPAPRQQPTAWADTLAQALALEPEHLSLYSLIVEPDTPLHHWVNEGGGPQPRRRPGSRRCTRMAMAALAPLGIFSMKCPTGRGGQAGGWTVAATPQHGLSAQLDLLAQCRLSGHRAGGAQPSAPGRRWAPVELRWGNRKPVGGYIKRVREGAEALAEFQEEIAPRLAMGETMMLGLRLLREGVCRGRFAAQHGRGS